MQNLNFCTSTLSFVKFFYFIFLLSITFSFCLRADDTIEKNLSDEIIKEYRYLQKLKYTLMPHKGTFILPAVYNNNPNGKIPEESFPKELRDERGRFNDYLETEFQISFAILTNERIFNTNFNTYFGYTHHSWWQIYNDDWSRPFRETNYEPEFFARKVLNEKVNFLGGKILAYDLGAVHQSNGEIQENSRSWNRVFARIAFVHDNLLIIPTLWYRIPEGNDDDNPRIYRYKGYGELQLKHRFEKHYTELKLIPGTKYTGYELEYSFPFKEGLRYYLKAGYGYGLSLQDYDHENRRIGVGFKLADPFSYNHKGNDI